MAYAPIPNIVTLHTPKIGCNQLSMDTLTEVLQSESVKRLLKRQNVYLQTPLTDGSVASDLASSRNSLQEKPNGTLSNGKADTMPELSVIPIMNLDGTEETSKVIFDDKHLLPSKKDGKSSVALLPLNQEQRSCGHSEPCETIVCDVNFQRLVDGENILPLVAVNIDSSEIDAPVSKHCENEKCDALGIDHDRCRRAVVRCHRCDRSKSCDICLTVLKTRKSQMKHQNCKMRNEYRHNKTSRSKLMRDRMRIREIQILEATKLNKNDYTHPITGHDRAFENLQKNSELIVIPQTMPVIQHHPTIKITSVVGSAASEIYKDQENHGKSASRYPLILPGRKMSSGRQGSRDSTDYDDYGFSGMSPQSHPFISIGRSMNSSQSLSLSDYLQTQSQILSAGSQTSSTPYYMPIRVVPIAGLKTEPSLLHQTQGVPKFCIVSQASNQATSYEKSPRKILPAHQQSNHRVVVRNTDNSANRNSRRNEPSEFVMKRFKSGVRRGRRMKNGPNIGSKSFECTFCFKRFSTDWYFKLHIAKHKGEIKYTCEFCKKPFMHHYNMTKHIVTMHKEEYADDPSVLNDTNGEFLHCSSCKIVFKTRNEMENHRCPVMCFRCHSRVGDGDLVLHLRTKHDMSEAKALEECERQKRRKAMLIQNRSKKSREAVKEQARGNKTKEETRERHAERENGGMKRKKRLIISNDARGIQDNESNDQRSMKVPVRRLTRRRNHSLVDQSEDVPTKKTRQDHSMSELELSSSIAPDTDLISR